MSLTKTWWTMVTDQDDPRFSIARKLAADDGERPRVVKEVKVPFWFAAFAQMNTEGVSAACECYIAHSKFGLLPSANPFVLIGSRLLKKQE